MSREFKREVRYIVIKLKDIDENTRRQLGNFMEDLEIPSRDCVVVESDWPEYEPVWKMIEDRVTGKAALASREGEAEPVAAVTGYHGGHCVVEPIDRASLLPVGMALYSGAQAAVLAVRIWKFESLAIHLRHCRECGKMDVSSCQEGSDLWDAVMLTHKERTE